MLTKRKLHEELDNLILSVFGFLAKVLLFFSSQSSAAKCYRPEPQLFFFCTHLGSSPFTICERKDSRISGESLGTKRH